MIFLHSTVSPNEYGKITGSAEADYDYKIVAQYGGGNSGSLEVDITRNELDVQRLREEYAALFEMPEMSEFPYTLDVFEQKTFHIKKKLSELKIPNKQKLELLQNELGKFKFTFYFAKNSINDTRGEGDISKFPYKPISSNRRKWLKQNMGVKIFRDNFRVRPYGEYGNDWLRLGDRYTTNPSGAGQRLGGYYIRRNQIVGAVEISRIDNKKFKAQFHTKAKMIPFAAVEEYLGHPPGGVCPFALKEGVKVYLDVSLRVHERVFPAAGSENSAIETTIDQLERFTSYEEWVDVCKK